MIEGGLAQRDVKFSLLPWARARSERLNRKTGTTLIFVVVLCSLAGFVIGFRALIAILTIIGFALALMGTKKPFLGIFGMSVLCTTDAVARALIMEGGLFRYNTFNYLLIAVLFLSPTFLLKTKDPQPRFLLLFVLVMAVGLLITPALDLGILSLLNVVGYFGLLYYFSRYTGDDRIWYWQALVSGILAGLGSLVFYVQQSSLPRVNPNSWAQFPLAGIFAICLGFQFAPKNWRGKVLLAMLAAVNLAWVFLSTSRGALLISLVAILFLVFSLQNVTQRVFLIIVAVLLSMMAFRGFEALETRAVFRIEKLFDPNESLVARTSGRSDLVKGAWYIFTQHPLGVGPGGFNQAWSHIGFLGNLSGFHYGQQIEAHAGWAKALAENGIEGFVLLLGFVASFAVLGWRRRRLGMLPLGLLVTSVFAFAYLSTEFQSKGLWFLAAAATVLLRPAHSSKKRMEPPDGHVTVQGESSHDVPAHLSGRHD